MGSELLEQAAALRDLASPSRGARFGQAHIEATVSCAERLTLAGYPAAAFELVDSVLTALPAGEDVHRLRLEIQAVRALLLDYRYT